MAARPKRGNRASRGTGPRRRRQEDDGSSHSHGDEVISLDESTKGHLSVLRAAKRGGNEFSITTHKRPGNSLGLKRLRGA